MLHGFRREGAREPGVKIEGGTMFYEVWIRPSNGETPWQVKRQGRSVRVRRRA